MGDAMVSENLYMGLFIHWFAVIPWWYFIWKFFFLLQISTDSAVSFIALKKKLYTCWARFGNKRQDAISRMFIFYQTNWRELHEDKTRDWDRLILSTLNHERTTTLPVIWNIIETILIISNETSPNLQSALPKILTWLGTLICTLANNYGNYISMHSNLWNPCLLFTCQVSLLHITKTFRNMFFFFCITQHIVVPISEIKSILTLLMPWMRWDYRGCCWNG